MKKTSNEKLNIVGLLKLRKRANELMAKEDTAFEYVSKRAAYAAARREVL